MTTDIDDNADGFVVRLYLPAKTTGFDGRVRAAFEMASLATRHPGCLGYERIEDTDGTTAIALYWTTLEAIDAWRERIYRTAAQRYSAEAWQTFTSMDVAAIDGRAPEGTSSSFWRSLTRVTERWWNSRSAA